MNCKNCGAPLTPTDQFCRNCGTTVPAQETNVNNNMGDMANSTVAATANNAFNGSTPNPTSMFSDVNNMLNSMNSASTAQPTMATPVNTSTQASPIPTVMPQPEATQAPVTTPEPMMSNTATNYNNTPQNTKSSKSGKYIFMAILAIAVIAAVVLVVMYLGQKEDDTTSDNSQKTTAGSSISNVSKAKYADYSFNVPNDMIYEVGADGVMVYDESGTWASQLQFIESNYSVLSTRLSELHTVLSQGGLTVSPAKRDTYGGIEIITLEATDGGVNLLFTLSKIDSNHVLAMTIANVSNEFDYATITKLAPIVSSVKYENTTNSIAPKNNVSFDSLVELSK